MSERVAPVTVDGAAELAHRVSHVLSVDADDFLSPYDPVEPEDATEYERRRALLLSATDTEWELLGQDVADVLLDYSEAWRDACDAALARLEYRRKEEAKSA